MLPIKAGPLFIDLVKACYVADLPIMAVGAHGIGKSEMLQRAAEELEIGCIVCDLSLMEPTDLIGLPRRQGQQTVYCPPAFLPTAGRGLLVFEELNRAPRDMVAPCLQLLTARRLNEYSLPSGWLPVAAVNPASAEYDVTELDPALVSRFVRVRVEPDQQEWLEWARQNSVHPDVVSYVASDRSVFKMPESNPRSWTYVSKILAATEKNGQPFDHILMVAVSGLVGATRAASFTRFLRQKSRPLSADDILSGYSQHRREVVTWVQNGKLDLVRSSLWALKTRLQAATNYQKAISSNKSRKNLQGFVGDLPGDMRDEMNEFLHERGYRLPTGRPRRK